MLKTQAWLVLPLLGGMLQGCGGAVDAPGARTSGAGGGDCAPIAGGATTFSSGTGPDCAGCSVTGGEFAIDGDSSSFASMTLPASAAGGAFLRAQAQPGVVFPAGSRAAARVHIILAASLDLNSALIVRTYLGEALQDEVRFSDNLGLTFTGAGSSGDSEGSLLFVNASEPFDAVEFAVEGAFSGYEARIFEFCSDSNDH